jgi:hypothetical protein
MVSAKHGGFMHEHIQTRRERTIELADQLATEAGNSGSLVSTIHLGDKAIVTLLSGILLQLEELTAAVANRCA